MPKIGKKSTSKKVVDTAEAVKETPTVREEQTKKQMAKSYIVFTENELRNMSQDTLDKVLIVYGINIKSVLKEQNKTRATEAFKVELILDAQLQAINTKGSTPSGLLNISGITESNLGFTTTVISTTINLGNFNSLKVEAGLSLPVGHDADLETLAIEQLGKQLEVNKNFLKARIDNLKEDMYDSYDKL